MFYKAFFCFEFNTLLSKLPVYNVNSAFIFIFQVYGQVRRKPCLQNLGKVFCADSYKFTWRIVVGIIIIRILEGGSQTLNLRLTEALL